jgi:acyl carrier protein
MARLVKTSKLIFMRLLSWGGTLFLLGTLGCSPAVAPPASKFVPNAENVSPLTMPARPEKPVPELPAAEAATVEEVQKIASELLGVEAARVRPESRVYDELGGDELDLVELVMELEEHFEISIPDAQLDIPYPRLTIARYAAIVDEERRRAGRGK